MIFILVGEDNFFINEKIKEIIKDEDYVFLWFKDKEFLPELSKYLNQRLFSKTLWLVIKEFGDRQNNYEDLIKNIRNKNLIFISKQKPEYFLKSLKENKIPFELVEIKKLEFKTPLQFENFLINYLKEENIKISRNLISTLAKVFFQSPYVLLNDLKKIKAYKPSEDLKREEIKELIKWPTDSRIFEMVDTLLEKKYNEFILRFQRELNLGNKVENIIGLLYKTLLRIYLLKKARTLKEENELGLNYFYRQKLKNFKNHFSEEEIKKLIKTLAIIDRKYKKFLLKEKEIVAELVKNWP